MPRSERQYVPISPKQFYRQINKAARLSCRGDMSAYLAEKIRDKAIADALGELRGMDRIYGAAMGAAIATVEARVQ